MTLPPALVRVASWCRSLPATFLLLVACAASCLLAVRGCNRAGRAEAALERAHQEGQFAAAGIAAAAELERKALAGRIEGAQRYVAGLESEIERAKAVVPGLRPIVVVTGSTGPVVAGGATSGAVSGPGEGPSTPPIASSPGRECLLEAGDRGEVRVSGAALQSSAGAVAVVGVAEAWRLGPDRRLFGGPLRLEVAGEQRARAPGWAWGAGGGISVRGSLGAVLVQTPSREIPLVHWPARAWLLAAGGASQGLALAGVSVEP